MKRKLLVIFITILAFNTNAQEWELVKNIENLIYQGSSEPENFIEFKERVFFTADDGVHGNELWVTNGAKSGTELFKDVYIGSEDSDVSNFIIFDEKLFFWATTKKYGKELWKSDGTEEGTEMVMDIAEGVVGNLNAEMTIFNDKLFFIYNSTETVKSESSDNIVSKNSAIYSIDNSNSLPVKQIVFSDDSFLRSFIKNDSHLFFKTSSPDSGNWWSSRSTDYVWSSDGTQSGTQIISTMNYYQITEFVVVNNKLYYFFKNGSKWELWESQGLLSSTKKIVELDSNPSTVVNVFKNSLYFNLNNYLYSFNLANNTLNILKDKYGNDIQNASFVYASTDNFYFVSQNKSYKSDGTNINTDFFNYSYSNQISKIKKYNEKLLLHTSANNLVLYDENTNEFEVLDIVNSVKYINLNKSIQYKGIFLVNIEDNLGSEIWKLQDNSLDLLKNIFGTYDYRNSTPKDFIFYNDKFYFTISNKVWESDGTAENTIPLTTSYTMGNANTNDFLGSNGQYYYSYNGGYPKSLNLETKQLKSILYNNGASGTGNMIKVNNYLYYTATDGTYKKQIWRYREFSGDYAELMTKKIPRDYGSAKFSPNNLTKVNNNFFFTGNSMLNTSVSYDHELYFSNGSEAGTSLIVIRSGDNGSGPSDLTALGSVLFFTAYHDTYGKEVWRSTGTQGSTAIVKDIYTGATNSNPRNLVAAIDKLFFIASDETYLDELWVTNQQGTSATRLTNIDSKNYSFYITGNFKNNVLLTLTDKVLETNEIWFSDGTSENTKKLQEVLEIEDEITRISKVKDEKFYFEAYNQDLGTIVYESNGTKAGTKVFSKELKNIYDVFEFNSETYVVTNKLKTGTEIYKYNPNGNSFINNGNFSNPSNWSKGIVPESLGDVNVEPGVKITLDVDNLQMKSFTLGKNATINIPEDKELTVTRDFNTEGNLELGSNNNNSGVLFIEGTSNGEITYRRGGLKANKWSLVTPPVSGQKIKEFATNTDNDIRTNETVSPVRYAVGFYDDAQEDGNEWVYYDTTIDENQTFTAGQSYAISRATDGAVSFTGTLTTSNLTRTLQPGEWNAIGNPFTTYYPANKNGASSFINDNYDILDDNFKGIYVWDNTQNKYVAASETDIENKSLTPGQGFFIKVKEGEFEIDFNEAKRTLKPVTGDTDFNKTQQKYIQLFADNGSNKVETNIKFFENATNGFDVGLDIGNFDATFDLFTKLVDFSNAKNYTIQSLPNELNEDVIIPLGVSASNMEVVFSTKHLNLELSTSLYLEDKFTKSFVDITNENDTYTVNFSDSDIAKDRFYLHILPNKSLNVESNIYDNLKVYSNNKILYVRGLKAVSKMEIINTIGQKVFVKSLNSDEDINLSNLKTGVYMIKLNSNNGNYVKKVILN